MGTISVTNNSLDSTGDGATHSPVLAAPGLVNRSMLMVRIFSEPGLGISESLVTLVVVVHQRGARVLHDTKLLNNLGGSLGNISAVVTMGVTAMAVTMFVMAMARELMPKCSPGGGAYKTAMTAMVAAMGLTVTRELVSSPGDSTNNTRDNATVIVATVAVFGMAMAMARELISKNSSSDSTDSTRGKTSMATTTVMTVA